MTDNNSEFDFNLWLLETHISDKGLTKLAAHEVKDRESLLVLTEDDVKELKLATADRAKFLTALAEFRGTKPPDISTPVKRIQSKSADTGPDSEHKDVDGTSSEEQIKPDIESQSTVRYTIEEVATFMAGGALPAILNETLNNTQVTARATASPIIVSPSVAAHHSNFDVNRQQLTSPYPVTFFPPTPTANAQPSFGGGHLGSYQGATGGFPAVNYHPAQAYPYALPQVHQQYPSSLPCYSPPQIVNQPGRLPTTQTLSRDANLHSQAVGYQNTVLRDLSSLNAYNPRYSGELYLPVNFCSHIRGVSSRQEDEELMSTEGGTKLYLANGTRKVTPDKLNQGLFLGANARILARIIPNPTPEILSYLDYLRKIGDLLVNYTSQSVYHLDNEHRFEVIEQNLPLNFIDPTLSLNILKRKDGTPNSTVGSKPGSSRTSPGTSTTKSSKSDKQTYGQIPFCWQWNQPDGCRFSSCRYIHKCSVENCGGPHPAHKHVFRSEKQSTSKSA